MSLRLRLIVFPIAIVLGGVIVMALLEIGNARERVRIETASAVALGRTIVNDVLARHELTPSEDPIPSIAASLPEVRHLTFSVSRTGQAQITRSVTPRQAPAWFEAMVFDAPVSEHFPVYAMGEPIGEVVITASPADEVMELWGDWLSRNMILTILSVVIIGVVVFSVDRALKPLEAIANGLDRLGGGDFDVDLPPAKDVELRSLSERFNSLAETLKRVTEDNRLLIDKLMSVQEAERKEIAHDLHDEFGPSLFGIRADLTTLSKIIRKKPLKPAEVDERLASIAGLVEQIQRVNSRLLEQLRPLVLDQMHVDEAVSRLVDTWRDRYPGIEFHTEIAEVGVLDESVSLALYRAARECLTNVVRHAEASRVDVTLRRDKDKVRLSVADNGKGLGRNTRFGFGLLGMAERSRALGGKMEARHPRAGGAVIDIVVPAKASA